MQTAVAMQEYRRRYNLEPLVKVIKREDEVLEQQGRARATVRPWFFSTLQRMHGSETPAFYVLLHPVMHRQGIAPSFEVLKAAFCPGNFRRAVNKDGNSAA